MKPKSTSSLGKSTGRSAVYCALGSDVVEIAAAQMATDEGNEIVSKTYFKSFSVNSRIFSPTPGSL